MSLAESLEAWLADDDAATIEASKHGQRFYVTLRSIRLNHAWGEGDTVSDATEEALRNWDGRNSDEHGR